MKSNVLEEEKIEVDFLRTKMPLKLDLFSRASQVADCGGQGTHNGPLRSYAFPLKPKTTCQMPKMRLPGDFIPELDKIEAFYDQYLHKTILNL